MPVPVAQQTAKSKKFWQYKGFLVYGFLNSFISYYCQTSLFTDKFDKSLYLIVCVIVFAITLYIEKQKSVRKDFPHAQAYAYFTGGLFAFIIQIIIFSIN